MGEMLGRGHIGEMPLLYGRDVRVYRDGIYAMLSEGKKNIY